MQSNINWGSSSHKDSSFYVSQGNSWWIQPSVTYLQWLFGKIQIVIEFEWNLAIEVFGIELRIRNSRYFEKE